MPGCREDSDCGPGFTCSQSHCLAVAGKVLLASLTVETAECRNCSVAREGVVVRFVPVWLPETELYATNLRFDDNNIILCNFYASI